MFIFTHNFPVLLFLTGKLLRWTKDFDAKGAVGEDVVQLLQQAFARRGVSVLFSSGGVCTYTYAHSHTHTHTHTTHKHVHGKKEKQTDKQEYNMLTWCVCMLIYVSNKVCTCVLNNLAFFLVGRT